MNQDIHIIHKDDFDGNIQYGGNKFHKLTKRLNVMKNISENEWGGQFFKKNEGSLTPDPNFFSKTKHCPNCSSEEHSSFLEVRGLMISLCSKCDFAFQNPRFKKDKLHLIYGEKYIMDDTYSTPEALKLDKVKFKYGIQRAREFNPEINSVLDVGCGPGYSLAAYEEVGIQNVYGLDPGQYEVNLNLKYSIDSDFIDKIPARYNNLNLITLWDVLEHIHDFHNLLESAHSALNKGGLILIMVPNLRSLATTLIREHSPTFQVDHLNYFSEKSLQHALEMTGYKCLIKETVISEIDNCKNYLNFKPPYTTRYVDNGKLNWLTSNYIHTNMFGSRLFFLAKTV